MEDPDDAMESVPAGRTPIAVYPLLPPLKEHDLRLTQETTNERQ
ncbi:hypothetical protein PC128_g18298 [Phytophthora cactorum]|nr:hypothetical protein PC121_g6482 [Phytophthora cactorum]KAG3173354.1 hypothetical protein PC128_g18298 [Phytophthora cactorum]KAG4048380.1 hypothetical protein PC123_g16307 [Phytophthora cactorum]